MTFAPRLARVPPFERGITIGDFLVPVRIGERVSARVRHTALILLGTALIVIGARISFYLPGDPYVPVTLQTFGVLFSGAALGLRRGVAASLLYLALGAVGLPVFAYDADAGRYAAGIGTIVSLADGRLVLGVTGGYLVGFVIASALVGRLAELGWDRRLGGAVAAMLIGEAAIFGAGVPWLALAIDAPLDVALRYGFWPFVPGDLLKLLAAAGLLPTAWWLVRRSPAER